jgi:RNA polymerase sigma factor (TIGR02999 family)
LSQVDLTQILERVKSGDEQAQADLFSAAYQELREAASALMRRERVDHTLQPSALVNEAALRLIRQNSLEKLPDRAYFFGAMVRAMRCALVDHARGKLTQRRGEGAKAVALDQALELMQRESGVDLVALDDALKKLSSQRERTGQIVELRFFGGLTLEDIAEQLSVSLATVNREWRYARAWLYDQLETI